MTPYGYRIVDGEAVIDSKAAMNIRRLYKFYLNGFPIDEAAHDAEIPLHNTSAARLLSNRVYLGTDFYPPIIQKELFDQVQEERKKRNRRPEGLDGRKFIPVSVKTKFRMRQMPVKGTAQNAAELVEQIYRSIQPYTPEFSEIAFSNALDDKTSAEIRTLFQTLP